MAAVLESSMLARLMDPNEQHRYVHTQACCNLTNTADCYQRSFLRRSLETINEPVNQLKTSRRKLPEGLRTVQPK